MFTLNEAYSQSNSFSASNVTCFIQRSLGPQSGSPSAQSETDTSHPQLSEWNFR